MVVARRFGVGHEVSFPAEPAEGVAVVDDRYAGPGAAVAAAVEEEATPLEAEEDQLRDQLAALRKDEA